MKRLALGAVAIAAAGWTAAAQAADLPYAPRAPYTVNQPLNVYSWAGPYLGGNLGYDWGSVDNNTTRPSGFSGGVRKSNVTIMNRVKGSRKNPNPFRHPVACPRSI